MRNTGLAAAAAAMVLGAGVPLALAAPNPGPTAVPPSDTQGYLNSTARCTQGDTAVVFGTTDTSRVAICKTAAGGFEYRGVRVSDGATLITTATQTSDDSFVAKSDGISYTVTAKALSVTSGGNTFRTEAWTDFNAPQSPATPTSGTAKPSTSASTSAAPGTSAPKTSSAPSSTAPAPLGPPLPAEVGGSSDG